jgi:glucuronate isomerase
LAAKFPGFSQALARDPKIPDYDKWVALCKVFPNLEGNHIHQWMHLDLKRIFGIEELMSTESADRVWGKANDRLKQKTCCPRQFLKGLEQELFLPLMIL